MGFQELSAFTHEMESVLDLLRTGQLAGEQHVVDLLFKSVDVLEEVLEATLAGTAPTSPSQLIKRLKELAGTQGATALGGGELGGLKIDDYDRETIREAYTQGLKAYVVHITLRHNTLLKSVRVFTIFQALESVGTVIKSDPPAHDLEDERFDLDFSLLLLTQERAEGVQSLVGYFRNRWGRGDGTSFPEPTGQQEAAAVLNIEANPADFLETAQISSVPTTSMCALRPALDKLVNLVGNWSSAARKSSR